MHRSACPFFLAVIIALSASAEAATPQPQPQPSPAVAPGAPVTLLAPADAYFGPFGMSPLSIRSSIGLLGREYHQRTISDHDLLRKALATEDALRKWRTAYPRDTWLAPTFFHLEQLYQTVQTDEARKHATAILKDVVRYYPDTKEGHLSRLRLAAGFPPLVPETPVVATPPPSGTPAALDSPQAAAPDAAATALSQPNVSAPPSAQPVPQSAPSP